MSSHADSPFRLDDQTALVTGGGAGLGRAITDALVAAGARVVIVGRREAVLREVAEQSGTKVFPVPGDVTDLGAAPSLVERAESLAGPLSILVNNAGIHLKRAAVETDHHAFAEVMQTHVEAAFALARAAAPGMLARRQGSIVFVGSMAALLGVPMVSAYSAAKAATTGLARALATEWSPHNVRVNTVTPGWIDSGMARKALSADPARKAKILGRTPMGRLGEGVDVGRAVVYLCSEAGRFITGTNLIIDGGASVGF